jgi:small conductance mechanosensitive channel
VQTTRLAALIAAAGVAIGVAWSGLPANFAAGIFLIARFLNNIAISRVVV